MSKKNTIKIPDVPYFKFESKEHAREWCLSDKCKTHLDYLNTIKEELREIIPKDNSVSGGMGYPQKKCSEWAMDFLTCEIDRIERTRDYFLGLSARGPKNMVAMQQFEKYIWEWRWDERGLKQAVGDFIGEKK